MNNEITYEIIKYLSCYDIVNLALVNSNSLNLLNYINQSDLRDLIKIEIYKLHHTYFNGFAYYNKHTILLKLFINRLKSDLHIKEILFYSIMYECSSAINYILTCPYININKLYKKDNYINYLLILAYKNSSPPIYKLLLEKIKI